MSYHCTMGISIQWGNAERENQCSPMSTWATTAETQHTGRNHCYVGQTSLWFGKYKRCSQALNDGRRSVPADKVTRPYNLTCRAEALLGHDTALPCKSLGASLVEHVQRCLCRRSGVVERWRDGGCATPSHSPPISREITVCVPHI